ncbi:MAG: formate dehydrogenase family accessory protein FdhD [Myxococcales bacterium]|nr:formate dehydrogenase family accessory protein FdhD [Myxococcales bacterium]|tara:strand:- start:313 stop:1098 length:786 start_codon:yes stop_codon:yes gene_type:complete
METRLEALVTWPTERVFPERREQRDDPVVVEEPLSIFLQGEPWTVTMRSPGHDEALALGLLYSEGLILSPDDVVGMEIDGGLRIRLREKPDLSAHQYALWRSSACGLCGAQSIEQLAQRWSPVRHRTPAQERELMHAPEHLQARQKIFQLTGGIHGASLARVGESSPLAVAEDVGRHNAVDKLLGLALVKGWVNEPGLILSVTSRVGFEIAAKAWALGCEYLVAVGAPTSLALETAVRAEITVAGFATGDRLNLYCGRERL